MQKNGMIPSGATKVSPFELARILRVFWIGLTLRCGLVLTLQATGVERSLKLTKDAFLYDSVGKQIAEHYRTNGGTSWPDRVSGVLDHMYEHFVGLTYYLTDDSMLAVRLVNVLAGCLVILATWRMARYITDADTAYRCGLWACFFPTQFYYSCLPVRDAQSTLAMTLVFLGMTALTSGGKRTHTLALPIGILMTAGYRTYVATVLVFLVPAGLCAAMLLARSENKSKLLSRAALLGIIALGVAGPAGIEKLSSTGKAAQVMDMDYWNVTRQKMNRGSGALYDGEDVPELGKSIVDTVQGIAIGLYFFFVSVNPTEIDSIRQWMAVPEVLIVVYMVPKLYRGFRRIMRHHRFEFIAVLFVALAITFAYSSVTTNAGPLMRWRLQVANVYIVIAAIGLSRSYSSERRHRSQLQISDLDRARDGRDSMTSGLQLQPSR
ncbi:MAG: glycosyltransferase family 39 protein [Planctomycetota bacterium]|nr:glycosyltransferase family 39 protein [Planctomycetota bacterium]